MSRDPQALKYRRTSDICPAEKVKIRFCPAQPSICRTFYPMEDFYYHKKCPAIKYVYSAVIPMKTTLNPPDKSVSLR